MTTTDAIFDRLPPHDNAAEMALLASAMLLGDDRRTFLDARRLVTAEKFFQPDHAIIWQAICDLRDTGKPVDAIMLRNVLADRGRLEEIGGVAYIGKLLNSVPSASHIVGYAEAVARLYKRRQAIRVADGLLRAVYSAQDGTEYISAAATDLRRIESGDRRLNILSLSDAVARFWQAHATKDDRVCLDTGLDWLDGRRGPDSQFRGVLRLAGYTIIAGRPSMGKSTWLRDRLQWQAMHGVPCGLIAIEEDTPKIVGNALSNASGLDNHRVADSQHWSEQETAELMDASDRIAKAPMWICDDARTISDVLAVAEDMAAKGARIVGVDHLHLIGGRERGEERYQELTRYSAALKGLWKDLRVAGIVAAQLRRPMDRGIPPAPQMSDLRDCGSIEEHADAILLIHREDYYHKGEKDYTPTGQAKIIVAKNRNGITGAVELYADLPRQRFCDDKPIQACAADPF